MSVVAGFDIDGSARGAVHTIPLGTPVRVTRGGVVQPWRVEVFRHDRNGTYRLLDRETMTYVTAHGDEVEPLA